MLSELRHKDDRIRRKEILIEGEKVIYEAVASGLELVSLIISEEYLGNRKNYLEKLNIPEKLRFIANEAQIKKLSSTVTPPGIFALVKINQVSIEEICRQKVIIAFDKISDPGNLGTMLRTMDWFGFKAVLLSPNTVDPFSEKVIRASMGSIFHLQLFVSQDWQSDLCSLKEKGYTLVVTKPEANEKQLPREKPTVLIMGSESHGVSVVSLNMADQAVALPGYGKAESLNVAVSLGIFLYKIRGGV